MKRIGKFYVTKELFSAPPPPLADFLHDIHVLSLKHETTYRDVYELVAEFDEFDPIDPDAEPVPEYEVIFESRHGGEYQRLPVKRVTNEGPIFDHGAFDRR